VDSVVSVAAADTGLLCDNCDEALTRGALCSGCVEHRVDRAVGDAIAVGDCVSVDEMRDEAASRVREWLSLERIKPAASLSVETIAAIERMAEDLEVS
jgi:hypothetical protein